VVNAALALAYTWSRSSWSDINATDLIAAVIDEYIAALYKVFDTLFSEMR
jgi:hypothetical protein